MRRVVFDTSVVVAGFRSKHGAANRSLTLLAQRALTGLATPALFLEYEQVLKRPEQLAVTGFRTADVDEALRDLCVWIEPVIVRYQWRPQLSDPDDEKVLEAAVNGRADAIITYNLRDFRAAARFGLPVITPGDLLGKLR